MRVIGVVELAVVEDVAVVTAILINILQLVTLERT